MAITPSPPVLPPQPRSNKPNSFPAKYLSNEAVLLETGPITSPAFAYIVGVLVVFGAAAIYLYEYSFLFSLIALGVGLLFALPGVYNYYRLSRTRYAMTDQRMLMLTGILSKTSVSVRHDQITSIEVHEPWFMGAVFNAGTIWFSVPSFTSSTLVWSDIIDPQETLNYILQIRKILEQRTMLGGYMLQASMVGSSAAGNPGQTKTCWGCRSVIRASARFCPYCGVNQP